MAEEGRGDTIDIFDWNQYFSIAFLLHKINIDEVKHIQGEHTQILGLILIYPLIFCMINYF